MKIKKILSFKKYISSLLIPLLLLFLWFYLSIIYNSYAAISVLTYPSNNNTYKIDNHIGEIYKGETIHGEIKANENNLGIISIRFNTFARINDDVLIYKIKEKGAKKDYYEYIYKVDQFQPDELFTFGFPIIRESKDKTYEFSLTSTKGRFKNAVAISPIDPIVVTKYQFTKNELLSDKKLFITHFWKKFLNSFSSIDFFVSSLVYLLPFVLYMFWYYSVRPFLISFSAKHPEFKYVIRFNLVAALILGLIIVNIIFVRQLSSDIGTLILIFSWIIISKWYSLKSDTTFLLALCFLLLIPLFSIFNLLEIAERSAVWLYYFLIIGILQQYFLPNDSKNSKTKAI